MNQQTVLITERGRERLLSVLTRLRDWGDTPEAQPRRPRGTARDGEGHRYRGHPSFGRYDELARGSQGLGTERKVSAAR